MDRLLVQPFREILVPSSMNLRLDRSNLEAILVTKVPYRDNVHKPYYPYGTAGFREYATELHPIMIRIGFAMALLSHHSMLTYVDRNKNHDSDDDDRATPDLLPSIHFGIMITASHNTYEYNGVKCIHMDGGMITPDGEAFVTTIVNTRDVDALLQYIQEQLPTLSLTSNDTTGTTKQQYHPPTIHIGYDTRSHSVEFANLVMEGIRLLLSSSSSLSGTNHKDASSMTPACSIQNHHIVTTPMLHHIVKHNNGLIGYYHHLPSIISTHVNTTGYYHILVHAYQSLLLTKTAASTSLDQKIRKKQLHVDCACGVAYQHLNVIRQLLLASTPPSTNDETSPPSTIVAHNPPSETDEQLLNHQCGSEFVQKQQCSCTWYDDPTTATTTTTTTTTNRIDDGKDRSYCASLDGDGDRIVFFATSASKVCGDDSSDQFLLLDGDYIACLLCTFIQNEIQTLQTYLSDRIATQPLPTPIRFGVVQTAYANGASTHYLQSNHIPVIMAKTGVKYVHAAAHDNYDVGIYFESNGHGTVIFNDAYYHYLSEIEQILYPSSSHDNSAAASTATSRPQPNVYIAYQRLKILTSLINQAVGDAISDLLLIDAILYIKDWTLHDWYASLYTNLPSRQMKVKVVDRAVIRTNDNETQCLSPTSVQPALDQLMEQYAAMQARIFIRPSGTEDVVRVYAEATTQEIADELAQKAIAIVQEFCGGV